MTDMTGLCPEIESDDMCHLGLLNDVEERGSEPLNVGSQCPGRAEEGLRE